ncbi:MAG: helix-turn-helix transcriptional regulator [Deltaproteobacteria bacterium]|nr:MAG: helix-turn-helix transcriptional regulator [Deltaproteobacteria bacterium]
MTLKIDISVSDPNFMGRMKEVVEMVGSAEKLAKLSGISSRGIGKYLAGETDPSRVRLVAIARATGVSIKWLATGEGPKTSAELDSASIPEKTLARLRSSDYAFIPLYDVRAAAGSGATVDSEEIMDLLVINRTWVRQQIGSDPAGLSFLYVEGDSMEPLLRPGEMILMDLGAANVPVDGIYVIRVDGHLMVKRIQREPGNVLTCSSANPAYKPITLDPSDGRDFAVIGRVVWHGRNL